MAMDDMSRATEELRVRRASYHRDVIRAPQSRRYARPGMYLIERGRANIGFELTVAAGDVVVAPRGDAHTIETVASRLELVVAAFEFMLPDHPLLQTLPATIHIPAFHLDHPTWTALHASLLAELARPADHPGRETMLVRISDVMIIEAMRHAPPPAGAECPSSRLLGTPDDSLRRVLGAIHDAPEKPWTVASLARVAGQSRSAFAAHFASVMNEPPMTYVARWRMFRARTLLRGNDLSIEQIAGRCGYGSSTAFSLAFTREHGISPGGFRRKAATRPALEASLTG
jgi:AraC-like DNA-binding protein